MLKDPEDRAAWRKRALMYKHVIILALKVILLDRLQGIICSGIQEPYLLGVML